jgi:hypothetical protein
MRTPELRDIAVVIGMPRAGTTWLYENMNRHPEICISDTKEINRYLKDMSDEEYLALFDFSVDRKKIGLDISPLYYFDLKALKRIAERHDKVIISVRDPREWLESLNRQLGKYLKIENMVRTSVYEFIVDSNRRLTFDFGNYDQQEHINQIRKIVGPKLLVLKYEDLREAPLSFLQSVEAYLGVSSFFNENNHIGERVNAGDAGMSRLYAFLVKTKYFDKILAVVQRILPSSIIHALRRRLVYGYTPHSSTQSRFSP